MNMWKISFTLLLLLNSFIGGLLFWQWDAYSEYHASTKEIEKERVTQKVSVTSKGNQLQITQLFEGLNSDKEYIISPPDKVQEWSCVKADGAPCESKDDNQSSYLPDGNTFTIQYQYDLKEGHSPFLLNHWLASLSDINITYTSLEIVDTSRRAGSWIAGLPLKGHNKFELIDYYYFEGVGGKSSLYWQPTPLERVRGERGMEYYSSGAIDKDSLTFNSLERIPKFLGTSIVLTDAFPETNGYGIMITQPTISNATIERKLIYNYIAEKADDLPLEERWIVDVLTSLITGQDSNVPKGQEFIKELRKNLTEEEIGEFTNLVIKETSLTVQKLDDLLGNVAKKSTHFFSLNKNEETKLIPLYYFDSRKVIVADKLYKDLEILIMNNNARFYPFIETMTSLGFDVKALADNETILLSNENNSYRFYVDQNIFIYNEENYGLLENPLSIMNGQIYMESSWLKTIFKIDLYETKEEIRISLKY